MSSTSTSNAGYKLAYRNRNYSEGVLSSDTILQNTFSALDTVTRAGPLPHYRYLIRLGQNATTALSGTKYTVEKSPGYGYWSRTRRSDLNLHPASWPNTENTTDGDMCRFSHSWYHELGSTVADSRALINYYKRCNTLESRFKSLTFMGELRESLAMIKNPARSLRRGISDYLDHVKKHGRKVARTKRRRWIADTWLEYSFGWKPLIGDIDNAIDAYYSSRFVRPIFQMVDGLGVEEKYTNLGLQQPTNGPLKWRFYVHRTESVSVRYYGIYHFVGNGVPNSHIYGWRPQEFIPTVWELIPYSFLVDYFTNIGGIVSSWAYRSLRSAWTARTERSQQLYESVGGAMGEMQKGSDFAFVYKSGGNPGSVRVKKVIVNRDPDVEPGVPSLELSVPGMTSLKWLNLLALGRSHSAARKTFL